VWSRLAGGAIHYARVRAARNAVAAASANLGQASLAVAALGPVAAIDRIAELRHTPWR
jgi:hypothetical protein